MADNAIINHQTETLNAQHVREWAASVGYRYQQTNLTLIELEDRNLNVSLCNDNKARNFGMFDLEFQRLSWLRMKTMLQKRVPDKKYRNCKIVFGKYTAGITVVHVGWGFSLSDEIEQVIIVIQRACTLTTPALTQDTGIQLYTYPRATDDL